MQLQIFQQTATREINAISWEQAQAIHKIAEFEKELNKLKESARYLYGKRRGAWGRMTQADEKRSNKIDCMASTLRSMKRNYETKFNTTF